MSAEVSIRIGDVQVTPLLDGWAPLPLADECPGRDVDWRDERRRFPWAFDGEASWAWHVRAFLLRTASERVLVDTGIGHLREPPYEVDGRIEDSLRDAALEPAAVTHVVHTHLHADHAGGACGPDGEPRFPNAMHHVHPSDWSFFAARGSSAREALTAIEANGRLDLDPADREVVPGVRVLHTPGHTPGHRSVVVGEGGHVLLLTGDLLHLPIQVAHPEWDSSHDVDPMLGAASRRVLLFRAMSSGWRVGVSHFARPFGRVGHDGWQPDAGPV
jgi:glyoxylase-like metal-dependent hydrolase (beta-lactamase superfamily II)